MWQLVSSSDSEERYPLFVDTENIIGRKDCSIVLKNDTAISRKHAIIAVTHPENHVHRSHLLPTVKLKDLSKFGTFVNQKKLGEECNLKSGDCIKFGSEKSKFSVKYEPLVVTTSCLDPATKKSTKKIIRKLGGHVVQEWQKDCSMVVMSKISVTIKVMCAMMTCGDIVTPEYFEKLMEAVKNGQARPEPTEFLPPLADSQVNQAEVSFKADPSRQALFQGRIFIFLCEKQFKRLYLAIELGGGVPMLMEAGSHDNDDSSLIAANTSVMECTLAAEMSLLSKDAQDWYKHVMEYLRKNKKRPITESELGFAALYISTEKYCNPDSDIGGPLLGAIPGPTLSQQVDLSQSLAYAAPSQPAEIDSKQTATKTKSRPSVVAEPVRVKEEPLSQVPAESQVKAKMVEAAVANKEKEISHGRKRVREDEENRVAEEPKRKQVKAERRSKSKSPSPGPPVTKRELRSTSPAKKPSDNDDDENDGAFDVFDLTPRRGQRRSPRKRSPGPATNQGTDANDLNSVPFKNGQAKSSRKRSPTPDGGVDDFETVPKRKGGQRKQSPGQKGEGSPVGQSDRTPARNSKKRTASPGDEKGDDEFDSIPLRTGGRHNQRQKMSAGDLFQEKSPVVLASESDKVEEKDFDSVPPRSGKKRRGRSKSRSPSPGKQRKGNAFDQIPLKRGKTSEFIPSEEVDGIEQNRQQMKKTVKKEREEAISVVPETEETDFDRLGNIPDDRSERAVPESDNFDTVPRRASRARMKSEPTHSPPSPMASRMEQDVKPSTSRDVLPRAAPGLGFLTTTKPIKDQNFIKNEENVFDPDVPAACTRVAFKSLVVRKQRPAKSGSTPTEWKGMPVKNYKKFKKTQHQGSDDLPRIIGGRDLIAHANLAKKKLMEKFAADLEMSQQEEESENCRDMFNKFSVPERKARGRR